MNSLDAVPGREDNQLAVDQWIAEAGTWSMEVYEGNICFARK